MPSVTNDDDVDDVERIPRRISRGIRQSASQFRRRKSALASEKPWCI